MMCEPVYYCINIKQCYIGSHTKRLKEARYEGVDWIHVAQDRDH